MKPGDDSLRRAQIAFQGKIVASATHEFQNHLAVIKEYNGLVRDLLGTRKPDKKTIKRCVEISQSIEQRANQAAGLIDTLNGFAHRGDRREARFRVDVAIAQLVALMHREAATGKIEMSTNLSGNPVTIINDPFLLTFLIFTLVDRSLQQIEPGGQLAITVSSTVNADAEILISADPMPGQGAEALRLSPDISACIDELGATVSFETVGTSLDLNVTVASRPAPADAVGAAS